MQQRDGDFGGTAPLQGKLTAYLIRRGLHAKLEEARLIPAKIQSMHGAEKATALAELQETLRDVTEVEGSTYVWVDAPLSGQGGVYGELEEPTREPSRVVTLSLMDTRFSFLLLKILDMRYVLQSSGDKVRM